MLKFQNGIMYVTIPKKMFNEKETIINITEKKSQEDLF